MLNIGGWDMFPWEMPELWTRRPIGWLTYLVQGNLDQREQHKIQISGR